MIGFLFLFWLSFSHFTFVLKMEVDSSNSRYGMSHFLEKCLTTYVVFTYCALVVDR